MTTLPGLLFQDAFETGLLETVDATGLPPAAWSVAGRGKKKTAPAGEDAAWWRANGPDMVARWVAWRKSSGWKVWVTPDGDPAIELDICVDIPMDTEGIRTGVPLKMFIDRVFITDTKELVIVDLKSGGRTPESDLQLGVYKYGLYHRYGIDIKRGAYWMARKDDPMDIIDLSRYTPELIETWFKRFRKATDENIFLPHPTFMCRACPVRDHCVAFGGSRSELDPDHPSHMGDVSE